MPVRSDQQIEAQILAVLIYSPGPEIYVVGEAHVLQLPPPHILLRLEVEIHICRELEVEICSSGGS